MENTKVIVGARPGKTQAMIAEIKKRYPDMPDDEIIRKLKNGETFQ